jgi:hypothetical protein
MLPVSIYNDFRKYRDRNIHHIQYRYGTVHTYSDRSVLTNTSRNDTKLYRILSLLNVLIRIFMLPIQIRIRFGIKTMHILMRILPQFFHLLENQNFIFSHRIAS